MQCKTENGQKCNDNWCKSWWLPSGSKWYPLVLRSNWKSLGWIIKIRLHFIISPQPCCLRDQVRCWCYTQLKADTKTGIIFLSVALWMDIKGINQLCRIRKRIIDLVRIYKTKLHLWNFKWLREYCGDCRIFLASCEYFVGRLEWLWNSNPNKSFFTTWRGWFMFRLNIDVYVYRPAAISYCRPAWCCIQYGEKTINTIKGA